MPELQIPLFKLPPSGSVPSLGHFFCRAVLFVSFCYVEEQPIRQRIHKEVGWLRRRGAVGKHVHAGALHNLTLGSCSLECQPISLPSFEFCIWFGTKEPQLGEEKGISSDFQCAGFGGKENGTFHLISPGKWHPPALPPEFTLACSTDMQESL